MDGWIYTCIYVICSFCMHVPTRGMYGLWFRTLRQESYLRLLLPLHNTLRAVYNLHIHAKAWVGKYARGEGGKVGRREAGNRLGLAIESRRRHTNTTHGPGWGEMAAAPRPQVERISIPPTLRLFSSINNSTSSTLPSIPVNNPRQGNPIFLLTFRLH